ncbi:MAG: nucleotidyltransferase family protein [Reyranellaceae bacterium]
MIRSAMILAAGRGERMRPLTDTRPKPLVEVAGRSLLERSIDRLVDFGVTNIVVNVHYLGDQIVERLGNRVHIIREERLLDTGGSVRNALPLLGKGPFFVVNGDGLWRDGPTRPLLQRLVDFWNPKRMDALLLLHSIHKVIGREAGERGDFFVEQEGHLRHRGLAQLAPYLFASISICDSTLFQGAPEGPFSLLELWKRAEARNRLCGLIHDGDWFHVGTPAALAVAERALA